MHDIRETSNNLINYTNNEILKNKDELNDEITLTCNILINRINNIDISDAVNSTSNNLNILINKNTNNILSLETSNVLLDDK